MQQEVQQAAGTTYSAIVGQVLAVERENAGFNQGVFADRIGISQATWSRIERGNSGLSIEQLARAARLLNKAPSEILQLADFVVQDLRGKNMKVEDSRKQSSNAGLLLLGGAAIAALVWAAKNK